MIKKLLLAVGMLSSLLLSGGGSPDLSSYKDMSKVSKAPAFVEDFEGGAGKWELGEGWKIVHGEGVVGSCAMKYTRTDPDNNKRAVIPITLQPDTRYEITLQYRTELKVDPVRNRMELFCLSYRDADNKRLGGSFYMIAQQNAKEWSRMRFVFLPRAGFKTAKLSLLLRTKRVGTIWIDNIVIKPFAKLTQEVHVLKPTKLSLNDKGSVVWKVTPDGSCAKGKFALLADVGGIKKLLPVDKNGIAKGDFGKFKPGKVPFHVQLLETDKKEIRTACKGLLFARAKGAADKKGNVEFDADGQVLVDGKPFLPIGIFTGFVRLKQDPDALKRIKEAGFNTVLSIGINDSSHYAGENATPEETLKASLDLLHKLGLKYVFSIKHQLYNGRGVCRGRKVWGKYNDPLKIRDMVIDTVKDHPAMLAWYVSDENPIDDLPAIRDLREKISEKDALHPTLTLTNLPWNFDAFARTGDALMYDAYPFHWQGKDGKAQRLGSLPEVIRKAQRTGLPFWYVTQMFPWVAITVLNKPYYPSVDEMRSQILLGAIMRVNAYFLYSYQHTIYYTERNHPGHSKAQWERVRETVKFLRELAPWILSKEKAPQVKVGKVTGKGISSGALTWKGKTKVMIVSHGPGKCTADIFVPGKPDLRSRFGKTVNLGGGRYRFTGVHVTSDVLE